MSPALVTAHPVRVEAPDGAAALELERRLLELDPTAVRRGGRWVVDIPAVRSVDALEVELRGWLRDIGVPATTFHVDGRRVRVRAEPSTVRRATHRDFIG